MYSQLLLKTPTHQVDPPTSYFELDDSAAILYIKNNTAYRKSTDYFLLLNIASRLH